MKQLLKECVSQDLTIYGFDIEKENAVFFSITDDYFGISIINGEHENHLETNGFCSIVEGCDLEALKYDDIDENDAKVIQNFTGKILLDAVDSDNNSYMEKASLEDYILHGNPMADFPEDDAVSVHLIFEGVYQSLQRK